MLNLKIKEPDYKQLYESRQAKIDSLNKTISGLKGRITRLENELNQSKKISDCSCWDIIDIDFGVKKCMGCGKMFNF